MRVSSIILVGIVGLVANTAAAAGTCCCYVKADGTENCTEYSGVTDMRRSECMHGADTGPYACFVASEEQYSRRGLGRVCWV